MARRAKEPAEKIVDPEHVAQALAKAIRDGDIVNFHLLFSAFSPTRVSSTEEFESDKYAYLLPDDAEKTSDRFQRALDAVRNTPVWTHIQEELKARRPAQLPFELVLMLADNAIQEEKYTAAAQAYELLRIRPKMRDTFLSQADEALRARAFPTAVRGYRIAAGLSYDYAAFPEPLPTVPDYQTRALMLHGSYPTQPEDCIALHEEEAHLQTAFEFLLQDEEAAARLASFDRDTRLAFLTELVAQIDPEWHAFTERYAQACEQVLSQGQRLSRTAAPHAETLEEEIQEQQTADPQGIMTTMLGREIEDGAWWQYLKELAYEHPAAVLFVSRQLVGENEIFMPRLRAGSAVPRALGLAQSTEPGPKPAAAPA